MGRGGYASRGGRHNGARCYASLTRKEEAMTREQLAQLNQALDNLTHLLGVAGEASTLGKKKDVGIALQHATEELKRCREVLDQASAR